MIRRAFLAFLSRFEAEYIGQPECPMMIRWTIANLGFAKLLVHYFPANVSDSDPHDHPRSFATLVLHGSYRDVRWEERSFEERQRAKRPLAAMEEPVTERLRAGSFRYRPAKHMHIVETDDEPCWTVVVMGPLTREWGFLRLNTELWWPWGQYIQRFGGVVRCDTEDAGG